MMFQVPIILASNSPRRKELLAAMGIPYTVDVSHADETMTGTPEECVRIISQRKALAVANSHPDAIILAADTLVYCDTILGKPKDEPDAVAMLLRMQGRWHEVYTGVSVYLPAQNQMETCVERTRVHFCPMSESEIRDYVATGEPMDKAGAYAIQGKAGMYIDRLEGSFSNVVGLPMHLARQMLKRANDARIKDKQELK